MCAGSWVAPLRLLDTNEMLKSNIDFLHQNVDDTIVTAQFVYLAVVLRAVGPAHTAHPSVTRQG